MAMVSVHCSKTLTKTSYDCQAVVAHTFNPSTLGGRGRRISEFEVSLVYRVSSRTARATQRNPVSKKPNEILKKSLAQVRLAQEVQVPLLPAV